MFLIRNYNKFLIGTAQAPTWDDFYIHRFPTDYKKLLKFQSAKAARAFLNKHPKLETEFDAWIEQIEPEDWTSYSTPWEPRR